MIPGLIGTEGAGMALSEGIDGDDIRSARAAAGLTQVQAAAVVHTSFSNWQNWEQGRFRITAALFELFLLKTGQFTLQKTVPAAENTVLRLRLRSGRVTEMTIKRDVLKEITAAVTA